MTNDEEIQMQLDELKDMISLTGWEEDFLDDMRGKLDKKVRLSVKEEERIHIIYGKHT